MHSPGSQQGHSGGIVTPHLPNQSRAFLTLKEEVHQWWHFQCSQRKRELDDNIPEQIDLFIPFKYAQTCSDTQLPWVYSSLGRPLENDEMGDRKDQEQCVRSLCNSGTQQTQSTMAKLPVHTPFLHFLGRTLWTLFWRRAGCHTFTQQQCAVVPCPLGEIISEFKQEWRC